jgi:hypothetical protein
MKGRQIFIIAAEIEKCTKESSSSLQNRIRSVFYWIPLNDSCPKFFSRFELVKIKGPC